MYYEPSIHCRKCGHQPLFGSLENGLCSDCIAKERRERELEKLQHIRNNEEAVKRMKTILEQNDKMHKEMMEQSERQHQQVLDALLPWFECYHCHKQERKDRVKTIDSKTYCAECASKITTCNVCKQNYVKDTPVLIFTQEEDSVEKKISMDNKVFCEETDICPECLAKSKMQDVSFWMKQDVLKAKYEFQHTDPPIANTETPEHVKAPTVVNETEPSTRATENNISNSDVATFTNFIVTLLLTVTLLIEHFYFGFSYTNEIITIGATAGALFFLHLFIQDIGLLQTSIGIIGAAITAVPLAIMMHLCFALLFFGEMAVDLLLYIVTDFFGIDQIDLLDLLDPFNDIVLKSDATKFVYYSICFFLCSLFFSLIFGEEPSNSKNKTDD